tara:strand:- start:119 stop:718 length:600 start_codon:yes stop_codon:yes gene_type:complete
MEKFINFSGDDKDSGSKINMDELFLKKQQQSMNVLNNYNKILNRIHNKIKFTSRQLINDECCWFIVPEFIIGIPKYNQNDCIAYVIHNLRENGFIVKYIHPSLIFISWKQWIPTYVRNEIKKKTGKSIDEYGNIKNENENNEEENNEYNNFANLNVKNLSNKISNNKNLNKENNFKDINSYKPSGLIYTESMLKKLNIN